MLDTSAIEAPGQERLASFLTSGVVGGTGTARKQLASDAGVRLFDFSFPSPGGDRVTSYLVLPSGASKHPTIIFHHWGFGSRRSFLAEAKAYARMGVASLLVDAPEMGARGRGLPRLDNADIALAYLKRAVVDVRAALDVLGQAPEVDAARVAYVGHSLGAAILGHLAALEDRFRGLVGMAPTGRISRTWSLRPTAEYLQAVAPLDGVNFIGSATRPILLQFGRADGFVPEREAEILVRAAPRDTTAAYYGAGHALDDDARYARSAWLMDVLAHRNAAAPNAFRGVSLPLKERLQGAFAEAAVRTLRRSD